MPDDIVTACLRYLAELAPDRAAAAELEIRQEWGGARVYVQKDAPAARCSTVAAARARGLTVDQAAAFAGVHRATAYRLMRRPRNQRG
jgi:hypothetical protein